MKRWLVIFVLQGCGSAPPTASLQFAAFDDPDNCEQSEAEIVSETRALWIGLREQATTTSARCVAIGGGLTRWGQLEATLERQGLLFEELAFGVSFNVYVMGLLTAECPSGDPSGAVRFCARGVEPITIDAERDGRTIEVKRVCPQTYTAQQCF